jgi:hypothetical protein
LALWLACHGNASLVVDCHSEGRNTLTMTPTMRLATQLTKQLIADQATEKPINLISLFPTAALAAAPIAALAVTFTTTFIAACRIAGYRMRLPNYQMCLPNSQVQTCPNFRLLQKLRSLVW